MSVPEIETVHTHLSHWIHNHLSVASSAFSGLPPCPYSKQAWVNQKVELHCCHGSDMTSRLIEFIQDWNNAFEVVILAADPTTVPVGCLQAQVRQLSSQLAQADLLALVDHPDNPATSLDHVNTSNGKYALVLVQRLSDLQSASRKLAQTGYYDHWSDNDMNTLVHWRSHLIRSAHGQRPEPKPEFRTAL